MSSAPWILLPILFPVFFLSVWCLTLWAIATFSGWRRLAQRFAEERPFLGETVHRGSARLGVANYSGVLTVGVSPSGLFLLPMRIFRPFHRPLLIPWSEIQTNTPGGERLSRIRLIVPRATDRPIILFGRAVDLVVPFLIS